MTTDKTPRRVLVLGRSQLVLDEIVAGLGDLGYSAQATNDFFSDVTSRFDAKNIDLVVFGGQVPPGRNAELREEMSRANPRIVFVQGLAGIPGLIISQIEGAFTTERQDPAKAPTYTPEPRTIRVTLAEPAEVKVTAWWTTSVVPPDPKSDSLVLLDEHVPAGDHTVPLPDHLPPTRAFATVQVDGAVYAFSVGTEQ